MDNPRNQKCQDCFFYEDFDYDEGFCHRYPPFPSYASLDGEIHTEYFLPDVFKGSWCGEFRRPPKFPRKCTVNGCIKGYYALGYCQPHYQQHHYQKHKRGTLIKNQTVKMKFTQKSGGVGDKDGN